jgi:hypothetical protein
MRYKLSLALLAFGLLASAGAQEAQEPFDEQVIEDFVTTRGAVFVESPKKPPTRPGGKGSSNTRPGGKGTAVAARPKKMQESGVDAEVAPPPPAPAGSQTATGGVPLAKAAAQPIGLGYTLYRVQGGLLNAVDPSEVFREGDEIRLALETNTDGYLYVFNTTDGGPPEMLYPHASLDGGANRVAAHRRESIPAGDMVFRFNADAGAERLFVVVSRRPLADVPAGPDLVAYCRARGEGCNWKPTPAQWSRLETLFRQGGRVRQGQTQLASLRPVAPETLTRGLEVKQSAARPAVVRLNESPDADLLVTHIDLVHK